MIRLIIKFALFVLLIVVVAYLVPGMSIDSFNIAIVTALVLSFVNLVLKPILNFFAFPINVVTLGISAIFINLGLFYLTSVVVDGFTLYGFAPTVVAAILIGIGEMIISRLLKED